jgi:hypothetical protein
VKAFIESLDKFVQRTEVEGYRKDLLVFMDFIKSKEINEYTWLSYLSGIDSKIIIDSLKYYITDNNVSSISAHGQDS